MQQPATAGQTVSPRLPGRRPRAARPRIRLTLMVATAGIAVAASLLGGGRAAASAPTAFPYRLCAAPGTRPDAYTYGKFRVDDNDWLGNSRTCIDVTGRSSFRVVTNLTHPAGAVEAYPSVFTGDHYDQDTSGGYLPMATARIVRFPAYVGATAHPPTSPSEYLGDFDAWYFNHGQPLTGHGTTELVVESQFGHLWRGAKVKIAGKWFEYRAWKTCQETGHGCDPAVPHWWLIAFHTLRPQAHLRISLGAFSAFLVRHRYTSPRGTLASVAYGFENWSGGRGESAQFFMPPLRWRPHR